MPRRSYYTLPYHRRQARKAKGSGRSKLELRAAEEPHRRGQKTCMRMRMTSCRGLQWWRTPLRRHPNMQDRPAHCHTKPSHTMPYHVIPYHILPSHGMLYHSIPCHTMSYHAIPCHTMPYLIIPCHAAIPYHTVPYFIIPCHVAPTIRYHTIDAGDGHDGGYMHWLGQRTGFTRAGIALAALHKRALNVLHCWVYDGTYTVGYLPPATYSCPLPTTTRHLLLPATYYYPLPTTTRYLLLPATYYYPLPITARYLLLPATYYDTPPTTARYLLLPATYYPLPTTTS